LNEPDAPDTVSGPATDATRAPAAGASSEPASSAISEAVSPTEDGAGAIRPSEGSTLHYALLWTDAAARARVLDRLALLETVSRTLDEVQDPGVAERKVHWWHEELERLRVGEPRHPRTVACAASLRGLDEAGAALLDVLSVAATTRYTPPVDDAEQRSRLVRDHGARLALLAHAASGRRGDLVEPDVRSAELALGLGLHATLARLPALLHRGHAVFSDAAYARHRQTPALLAGRVRRPSDGDATDVRGDAPDVGAGCAGLLAEQVDTARTAIDSALADADYRRTYARAELAPIARLAALRARQLRLWQEQRPDLLRETVTPTPLVKLYIAWRHRRGARQA